MNKEFNQNTRTLIVSFVFALMVMIPLRFVEFGNSYSQSAVLGESVTVAEPKIEAPYDVVDDASKNCIASDYVDKAIVFLKNELKVSGVSKTRLNDIEAEIVGFEKARCN